MSTALQVDQIFNLACPASPPHYQYNTIKTLKTSFLGAINMLGLAKRCKVNTPSRVYLMHPRILQIYYSTAEILTTYHRDTYCREMLAAEIITHRIA